MKPYAIFLSLTDNYTHLFNALFNSVELLGIGQYADIVVIHDGLPEGYIELMNEKCKTTQTQVHFERVVKVPGDEALGRVMAIKFYRYKIISELGINYRAVCFTDTDIFFASGLREYFDIAANTDLIVGVNDNVVRHYKSQMERGTCPGYADTRVPWFKEDLLDVKFICNTPQFLDMRKYAPIFRDVFEHRGKLGMDNSWPFTGDLETMNLIYLKHGIKSRLLVLGSHMWTGVHQSIYRVSTAARKLNIPAGTKISSDGYRSGVLFISETCEHIHAFHGRDWTDEDATAKVKEHYIPKLLGQMEGDFSKDHYMKAHSKRCAIYDQIQAYFLFLQFHCAVSLDDVHKVAPVRQVRFDYMKRRAQELKGQVLSYGRD